jgi:2-dehydropantoate 2-reductase
MKVAIIGPGAMGCLYAARLCQSGASVYLVDYKKERADRLEKSGITVDSESGTIVEHPAFVTQIPTGLDLVIVLTKAHSTDSLRFPPETPVITLQNGLGNVDTLCSIVGSARLMAGTTSEAAMLVEEGHIEHVAAGVTRFGAWTSCATDITQELLSKAGFAVEISDAPGQLIWEKTAINAGINPLAALLDVSNGKLLELKEIRQLMRDLVVEAAKVASTEGYRFNHSLVEIAEDICAKTSENICSMLQDVRAGKQTENEAISGEILRRAQIASLPTPRTRVVYQLIRGLENR